MHYTISLNMEMTYLNYQITTVFKDADLQGHLGAAVG